MTITRTTISGIEGLPQPLAGMDVPAGARRRIRDAALAAFTVGLLLLVAF